MGAREKDLNPDVFIGLKLPMGYSDSGYFKQTKTTLQQEKYNIINLLKTIPGERLGQPAFGSELHTILFEPMDEDFSDILTSSEDKNFAIEEIQAISEKIRFSTSFNKSSRISIKGIEFL